MNTKKELFFFFLQENDKGNIEKSFELAERLIFLYRENDFYFILGLIYAVID